MRYSILTILLFISSFSYSQLLTLANPSPTPNTVPSESYVIGIGNSEIEMYADILDYLQNKEAVEVYAVCESHHIIGFRVLNSVYKSYDIIRDQLQLDYPELILLRKNETIFTKDCSEEILKQ